MTAWQQGTRAYRLSGTPRDRPSPLENRVLPTGEIVANSARGMLMGNRGCIHGLDRELGASRWRTKRWISCVLAWQNVRRDVMPPHRWTALFFLDEATALAAGHRPCGYCRRADHSAFGEAWRDAQGIPLRPRADAMDAALHAERVDRRTRRQSVRTVRLRNVPAGAMIRNRDVLWLVSDAVLLPWSITGYGPAVDRDPDSTVELLTPPVIAAALSHGYRPLIHPSAGKTPMRVLRSHES